MTADSLSGSAGKSEFTRGYICCLANIVNSHGAEVSTVEAYRTIGAPTLTQLKPLKLQDYDKKAIKALREYMK